MFLHSDERGDRGVAAFVMRVTFHGSVVAAEISVYVIVCDSAAPVGLRPKTASSYTKADRKSKRSNVVAKRDAL